MDCSPPVSPVHRILQARILEWVAIFFPRDLPHPGSKPGSPALQVDCLLSEPPRKPFLMRGVSSSGPSRWRGLSSTNQADPNQMPNCILFSRGFPNENIALRGNLRIKCLKYLLFWCLAISQERTQSTEKSDGLNNFEITLHRELFLTILWIRLKGICSWA